MLAVAIISAPVFTSASPALAEDQGSSIWIAMAWTTVRRTGKLGGGVDPINLKESLVLKSRVSALMVALLVGIGLNLIVWVPPASADIWAAGGTMNLTSWPVQVARHWTCNDDNRWEGWDPPSCDGVNPVLTLRQNDHTPSWQDWDIFRVDQGCLYEWSIQYAWAASLGRYRQPPVDRRTSSPVWVRVHSDQHAFIDKVTCNVPPPANPPGPPPPEPPDSSPPPPMLSEPVPAPPRNPADLNGDNRADLLAIYDGSGGMYWYPGRGSGTFWSARYIDQAGFKLMAKGDLNGDGKADLLAIYDGSGGMYWYPGKGDGTFWSARYIDQAGFRHMELADLNRDGKLDLLAIYEGSGGMYWYPGKGDGTFWSARYIDQAGFKNMALGDLNGDGKADLLAIYDGSGGMYWYPGKGDGTFWSARYIDQAGFRHMELADLNQDGKRDLLAIYDGSGGMYWYPGKGDGTFWSARYIDQAGFKLMAL
jgi:uncharacterized membrane protein